YLDVTVDSDDRYQLTFLEGPSIVSMLTLGPIPEYRRRPGLVTYTVDVPPGARDSGFNTILITPSGGDEHYAVGHLLLGGDAAADALGHRRGTIRAGADRRAARH